MCYKSPGDRDRAIYLLAELHHRLVLIQRKEGPPLVNGSHDGRLLERQEIPHHPNEDWLTGFSLDQPVRGADSPCGLTHSDRVSIRPDDRFLRALRSTSLPTQLLVEPSGLGVTPPDLVVKTESRFLDHCHKCIHAPFNPSSRGRPYIHHRFDNQHPELVLVCHDGVHGSRKHGPILRFRQH